MPSTARCTTRATASRSTCARILTLPGAHNWQNAGAAYAACRALGVTRDEIAAGLRYLSRPGASPGARRRDQRRRLRQRQQGDQRRRHREGAGELRHDLLDRRRPAQGRRHRAAARLLPAHRARLPDRRSGRANSPPRSRGKVALQPVRHAGSRAAGGARRWRSASKRPTPSCCCRRPAPRSTSSPSFEARGDAFRAAGAAARRTGGRHDRAFPHRYLRRRPLVVDRRSLDAGRDHRRRRCSAPC